MKILVIDDEIEILSLFKDVLESIGHSVEIAIDGSMGLEKFNAAIAAKEPFNLIVMDYRMYGRDGLSISEEILTVDSNVKILFASADSSVEGKALEMGATGFLLKPFDIERLIEEIGIHQS